MAVDIIAVLTLVAGIYILYEADDEDDNSKKIVYSFTGLVATIWAVMMLFGTYTINIGILPLAFGLFAIGTIHTKGATQAVFGATAILIFLHLMM